MNRLLEWLRLDGLPPAFAWGIVALYALFLWWGALALLRWRLVKSAGVVNLDRAAAQPRSAPAFATENVAQKREYAAQAAAYVNPEVARERAAAAAAAPPVAAPRWSKLERAVGIVTLVLGLAFIALLVYGLVTRPAGDSDIGFLLSNNGWKTLLATHWILIVFTVVRTGSALLALRRSRAKPGGLPVGA